LQEFILVNLKLFENIGEKIRTDGFGWMDGNRSPATILMVEYGMTTLLPYLLETQCLKTIDYFTCLE